jgi:hypothetical protein
MHVKGALRSWSLNQRWVFGLVDHVKIGVKIPSNQNKERTFKTKRLLPGTWYWYNRVNQNKERIFKTKKKALR